jgi:hypothetical protein
MVRMINDLEGVMAALWAQLFALVVQNNQPPTFSQPFAYGGRRLRISPDNMPANKPAIMLHQPKIRADRADDSVPGKFTVMANIWIVTDAGLNQSVEPIIDMNRLIFPVLQKLKSNDPIRNVYTIPNTQARVRIDGDVITDAGDLDGNGLAIIPLKIIIPNF